jgi:hypothetical protein
MLVRLWPAPVCGSSWNEVVGGTLTITDWPLSGPPLTTVTVRPSPRTAVTTPPKRCVWLPVLGGVDGGGVGVGAGGEDPPVPPAPSPTNTATSDCGSRLVV